MTSLFAPLDRVVQKYRSDVNRLPGPASPEALTSLEAHLARPLPRELRLFLERHNGASMLRGAIRVRTASETAHASDDLPQVVLFADVQEVAWAWAPDGAGGHAFGTWSDGALTPQHSTFSGWLRATLSVTEARVTREKDLIALRLEADRNDPYQQYWAGVRALQEGDPDTARTCLEQATGFAGTSVAAWQRLGDALAVADRSAARAAWSRALKQARIPFAYPGCPAPDPDLFRALAPAYSDPEDYERELSRFLDEQVHDANTEAEAALMIAAGTQRGRSALARGRRELSRDALGDLLSRCRSTSWGGTSWPIMLQLARLEADLGNHDEAEALLRRIRQEGPAPLQGPSRLVLASIAISREEPWAEEIIDEALHLGLDAEGRALAATLHVERAVRREHLPEAARWLERAEEASADIGLAQLAARVCLVRGDLERAAGDIGSAHDAYRQGLKELGRLSAAQHEPELRYRLELRLGDVALAQSAPARAYERVRAAVEGFSKHQFPVREAWALLRLARLVDENDGLLKAARQRFEEADLAAGVSAVDATAGDAGLSLDWHLHRATSQARARHDARRSRPPWVRADAERPERRLGAHRLAVAACGLPVVERLAGELNGCARAMSTGRVRAVDTPVLRYVAAVDLLAGHRSWRAAQVLLDHLVEQRVTGPARNALQAAVARSPNAALVDGLLRAVEHPSAHPASVVAEAAEALGLRREKSALKALVALTDRSAHPVSRKAAITALARIGDRSVVDAIVPALADPVLEAPAALALLLLGDRRGVDFHARALTEDRTGLTVSPGEIVGRYGGATHHLLLLTAARGQGEGALGALQGLGLLGDPRAVPDLLEALDRRDRRVVEVAAGALQILTGHSEQLDEPGWKTKWNLWWERESARFAIGVRHRQGEVFAGGLLIERMQADDPWTRRTAYDELVITSGENLPFDSDGPWRVQQAHLQGWKNWWLEHGRSLRPGRWYLDGQEIV
ncbi:MAG: HEAT repeat domain-containing protein [Myxococcota bacterium]